MDNVAELKYLKKIDILESIIEMQNGEIEKYRSVLQEIGAKLDISEIHPAREFEIGHNQQIHNIQMVHIYLNKEFAINNDLHIELDAINELLRNSSSSRDYGKDIKFDEPLQNTQYAHGIVHICK